PAEPGRQTVPGGRFLPESREASADPFTALRLAASSGRDESGRPAGRPYTSGRGTWTTSSTAPAPLDPLDAPTSGGAIDGVSAPNPRSEGQPPEAGANGAGLAVTATMASAVRCPRRTL